MPYIFHLQSVPFSAGKQSSNARDHPSSSSESDIDKLEEKAQKDMEERDALSKRIRDREKQNVRHIVSKVSPHMHGQTLTPFFYPLALSSKLCFFPI